MNVGLPYPIMTTAMAMRSLAALVKTNESLCNCAESVGVDDAGYCLRCRREVRP